jgi:D-alanyl-D-alanine carboxypeptidase/D-alanyl-D-alanine-endopeptidase (penicillin-binding protein 4)
MKRSLNARSRRLVAGVLVGLATTLTGHVTLAPAQEAATPARFSTPIGTAGELGARLDAILSDPALARAHIGLTVQVAETGEILYERNGEKRFIPASNNKIITAAVALDVLGPGYRWTTRLLADGTILTGTLRGDLWVVGSGDPWLTQDDVDRWPELLREAGIRRVTGDLVGDDRAFAEPQWADGWTWGDTYAGWGAGVSGLQVSPNTVALRLFPGPGIGGPAILEREWPGPELDFTPGVYTGAPGSELRLRWLPGTGDEPAELAGWIALDADTVALDVAARDPTQYVLELFRGSLERADIRVDGQVRAIQKDEPRAEPSWAGEIRSDSLGAVLAEMLKESDNQMAESILRTLGLATTGMGSAQAGIMLVEETLARFGVEPDAVRIADGSGLSRNNLVTPNAMTRLLRAMWRHPQYEVFLASMPIAGVDGTLRKRLVGTAGRGNVRAKTGSLSTVRALSGYLTDGRGETLVFSLLLNGYDTPGDVAVALEDLLVEQIALYRRPVDPGWPQYREDDQ